MITAESRYSQVNDQIQRLCERYKRNPNELRLLAVSKTKPISAVQDMYGCGQRLFGENYLQEAVEKRTALAELNIEWHFIGPLQSNKTRLAAENMDWVHTIDRLKIARRLSEQRPANLPPLNVLVQVNISNEASKSGLPANEVEALLGQIAELPGLRVRGLMTIPAASDDFRQQRLVMAAMKKLYDQCSETYPFDTLSMGMSGDMEAAIAEGSTMLRIGTALFGGRENGATTPLPGDELG